MRNPSERSISLGRALSRRALLLLLAASSIVLPAAGVWAQPAAPAAPASAEVGNAELPAESRSLRREVEALYEVLPLRDGVVLSPKTSRSGVRSIEIAGDAIAVNGERVNESVVRAWLGDAAGPVLRLAALPAAERRALFDLPSSAGVPAATGDDEEAEAGSEPVLTEEAEEPDEDAVPEPPVPPVAPMVESPSGDAVRFGATTIKEGETTEDLVVIGGPVHVDGEVSGDLVAIGGPVYVEGRVGGDLSVVHGSIHLGPKSEVEGEISAVGGTLHRAPGARIHRSPSQVSFGPHFDWDFWPVFGFSPAFAAGNLVSELAWLALMALLLCLTLAVGHRRVARAEARIVVEPWKCGLVGLLAVFAFVPLVLVATALTCCLAVLLYPFLGVAVVLIFLLGYTAVAVRVGRWAEGRFGWRTGNPYLTMLVGFGLLEVLIFLSDLLHLGGGMLHAFAFLIGLAGTVVLGAALFVGIGAVLIDFFEERSARRRAYEGSLPPLPPPAAYPPGYAASPAPPVDPVAEPAAPPPPVEGDRGPEV